MIEPGPVFTINPVDFNTALLYTITCTHNNHYDWKGVGKQSISDTTVIPWRRKDNGL